MPDLHPGAEDDITAQLAYYLDKSPMTAERFEAALERAMNRIDAEPKAGSPHRHGTLKQRIKGFRRLRVIYKGWGASIIVYAMAHGSRDEDYWVRRLEDGWSPGQGDEEPEDGL